MTILEHGLAGGIIVYKFNPQLYWWGVVAGVFPDFPPFLFAVNKVGFKKAFQHFTWKAIPGDIPESVYVLYDITHSIITTVLFFICLYLIKKDLAILALSYGSHILLDIPFHNSRFSTRFLYPLSNFHIRGYSQRKHRWIHLVSLTTLAVVYILLLK